MDQVFGYQPGMQSKQSNSVCSFCSCESIVQKYEYSFVTEWKPVCDTDIGSTIRQECVLIKRIKSALTKAENGFIGLCG